MVQFNLINVVTNKVLDTKFMSYEEANQWNDNFIVMGYFERWVDASIFDNNSWYGG